MVYLYIIHVAYNSRPEKNIRFDLKSFFRKRGAASLLGRSHFSDLSFLLRSRLLHPRFFNLLTLARASLLLVVRIFNVLVHDLVKKNDILISWRLNQTSILFPRSGQVLSKYQTPYYHHHENPCGHIRPILCANHEGALAYSKYIPKVADPPL